MTKFAKGNNPKKLKQLFFTFSPCYLLIIFYQLTKFEATCCKSFLRYLDYKFSMPKFAKGNNSKIFLKNKFSPGYLLIIFYQLTKFDATCCNSFLRCFKSKNVQRAITPKNKITFFLNFTRLSTHYPLLPKFETHSCYNF